MNNIAKEPVFYVITICWNESPLLKYFLDYYSFATKIIIFDNMSSDNSVEIMKGYNNVEICSYNTNEQIRDDIYIEIKNHYKNYMIMKKIRTQARSFVNSFVYKIGLFESSKI